jgi:Antibiotic biosynthesis monooxygenase
MASQRGRARSLFGLILLLTACPLPNLFNPGMILVPMTTISKDARLVTLINVFSVEPANQQRLVELLARATDTSVRHVPGFVSATLHRSLSTQPLINDE